MRIEPDLVILFYLYDAELNGVQQNLPQTTGKHNPIGENRYIRHYSDGSYRTNLDS